ncbi:MAG: FHA domain-containing protein, partial [Acidobacteriota bacterium]
ICLPQGAAAAGALANRERLAEGGEELPVSVRLEDRPMGVETVPRAPSSAAASPTPRLHRPPTHLAHDGLAYPIGAEPFWLGLALQPEQRGLNLVGNTAGISRSHCFVRRDGDRVVVEDHSTYGTYVNDRPIDGSTDLEAGDRLRLGSPGIELELIAVLESDG